MKILVFTTLFPNNVWPNHGIFIQERMSHVARNNDCQVKVIAPVPYFPSIKIGWRWHYSQVVRHEMINGIEVFHPRYFMIPKIGMAAHGWMMFLSVLPAIKKLKKQFDFDLIDAHYLYPDGFAAVLLGRFLGRPVVVSARGSDINVFPKFPLIRRLLKHTLCSADKIVAVSKALRDAIVELGVSQEKISVIPNGVDAKKFYPTAKSEARSQLGLPAEQKLIVSVGGLTPVKGFDLLIRAFRLVIDASPGNEPRLFIIGEGRSRKEIEHAITSLNLSSHVQLVGAVPHSQLHLWYSAADLFCLASEREGWPNVLLESLACGTPVLAPSVGGIPEIINSEDLGFLAQRNEYEMARKIRLAIDRTWNSTEIVARAREHGWDKAVLNTIGVFESVLLKNESGDRRVSNEV
ncbi:MAG TPA: glycosyltransferase family 4 protein, partial [Candidatus Udaeobacter sp.]|nr:glycosyltransferase family 4 protein [Candidatus Udaeobacter sp.]